MIILKILAWWLWLGWGFGIVFGHYVRRRG